MRELPFKKIFEIQRRLDNGDFPPGDLVLICSHPSEPRLLLIYNQERAPIDNDPQRHVFTLLDLHRTDLETFNGPTAGFPAVDVLIPQIPTHGANFYNLEHYYRQTGRLAEYRQQAYRLAHTLWKNQDCSPDVPVSDTIEQPRACIKIMQLALPHLLAEQPLEGLAAVVVDANLDCLFDSPNQAIERVYIQELERLPALIASRDSYLIALEEVVQMLTGDERYDPPSFIELRPILRQAEAEAALKATCLRLASGCYTSHPELAYSLAASAWLAEEDVDDLVALLPHEDFERFIQHGDAIRVTRLPRIYTHRDPIAGRRASLGELVHFEVQEDGYRTRPLAFPILSYALTNFHDQPPYDLGPVLVRAGQETQLARSFWLLSRDLLRPPASEWQVIDPSPQAITDLAIRAAMIYGLSDPWQWRQGRYGHFLEGCYAHLNGCLNLQEKRTENRPLAAYYRALREWYGCYRSQDIQRSLSYSSQACQTFFDQSQISPTPPYETITIRQLQNIINTLQGYSGRAITSEAKGRMETPQRFDVSGFLDRVANSQSEIAPFSQPFEQYLATYQELHSRWRGVQHSLDTERPSYSKLNQLLEDYRQLQRAAHIPVHELAALDWACQEDIARILRLKQSIEAGPVIQVTPRTPWVMLGRTSELTFEVENLGGMVVTQFQLQIEHSRQFEFRSSPAPLLLESLAPGRQHKFTWEVQPLEPTLELNLSYSFLDPEGELQTSQQGCRLESFRRREIEGPIKQNLYQAGVPVAGVGRFFGREAEIEQIFSRLLGGITQPLLLRGPRRMGKTSLLQQVRLLLTDSAELQRQGYSDADILQIRSELHRLGYSDADILQLGNVHPVMLSLQSIRPSDPLYVARFYQDVFSRVCQALQLEDTSEQHTATFNRFPARAFHRLMNGVFQERSGARLLVIVDEWDELNRVEFSELSRNLRSTMEDEKRINWLVSSTWTLVKEAGKYGSPFFNQSLNIELKEMDWEASRLLIKLPSEKMGVAWVPEAGTFVQEQTGRRPYLIQLLCTKAIDRLNQEKLNLVELPLITRVTAELLREAQATEAIFGYLWGRGAPGRGDRVRWMGRLILYLVFRQPGQLTRADLLEKILRLLQEQDAGAPEERIASQFDEQIIELESIFDAIYLSYDGSGCYEFSIPLVQRWLQQVIARQDDPLSPVLNGILYDLQKGRA